MCPVYYLLLSAILEGMKDDGFSEDTRETIRAFLHDQNVLKRLDVGKGTAAIWRLWRLNHQEVASRVPNLGGCWLHGMLIGGQAIWVCLPLGEAGNGTTLKEEMRP